MSPTEIALPFAPQLYAEALVGGQQIREADDAKGAGSGTGRRAKRRDLPG